VASYFGPRSAKGRRLSWGNCVSTQGVWLGCTAAPLAGSLAATAIIELHDGLSAARTAMSIVLALAELGCLVNQFGKRVRGSPLNRGTGVQKAMAPIITLRASQSMDAELFYFITEETMRPHVVAAGGTWEEERRRKEAAEDATNPGASVVLVGSAEAGILAVEKLPREIRLHMLYLLPSFQGLGVGSSLLSSLQQEVSRRGVPLRLQVLKVNPAKGFYEHLGFCVVEETEYFFHMVHSSSPPRPASHLRRQLLMSASRHGVRSGSV